MWKEGGVRKFKETGVDFGFFWINIKADGSELDKIEISMLVFLMRRCAGEGLHDHLPKP